MSNIKIKVTHSLNPQINNESTVADSGCIRCMGEEILKGSCETATYRKAALKCYSRAKSGSIEFVTAHIYINTVYTNTVKLLVLRSDTLYHQPPISQTSLTESEAKFWLVLIWSWSFMLNCVTCMMCNKSIF